MSDLTQQQLQQIFHYDPVTGELTYLVDQPPKGKAGAVAGWINSGGYRRVSIQGKDRAAHVVIWLWMTGELPTGDIDHIDSNRTNNVWANLRLATRAQNLRNQGTKFNNRSGFKGVTSRGNSHSVRFRIDREVVHIGSFPTAREAAEAYDREIMRRQESFTKTNKALGLL